MTTTAMPTEGDKRSKILEKVRAILALADDEQARNPDAADNYRAKADEMMTAYAIEQWMVEQARNAHGARPKPECRYIDFGWWRRSQFRDDLYSLFCDVANHCRCRVAVRGYGKGDTWGTMPVIGLPSDLDYFDMLFTHLMLQMGKQLEPKPDLDADFGENAYNLRRSGMARPRVAQMLYDAGLIPGTGEGTDYWDTENGRRVDYRWLAPNKEKSLRAKVRVAGEKYAKDHGLDPTTTVNPKVWQRSFSAGFVQGVATKLWELRKMQESKPGDGESMALVIRDIRHVIDDLYNQMFPPPEPSKEVVKGKRRASRALTREVRISTAGLNAGRKAGKEVDVAVNQNRRVANNPKGLPSA